tara:strand:+ start:408 stop:1094 length:687 start_codon:yes stop_codon:yes gene_type:complete
MLNLTIKDTSMKKLTIIALALLLSFSSQAFAEMRYGVSLAYTFVDADGSETEGGEKTTKSVDNQVVVPSLFAEYSASDVLSLGIDFIPLSADVSDKTHKRTDVETSVTGTATAANTTRNQKAQAELENHITLYANYNINDTYYLKGGVAFVTLTTDDTLDTGSKYGDEDIFGGVFGIGAQEGNLRAEVVYTDYEDISLTSSVARTGVTPNNKIDAELDTLAFRLSYVF